MPRQAMRTGGRALRSRARRARNPPPPRGGPRDRVIRAAASRFATLGYEATRLEDIGADVGIGRPAVLFHFEDKLHLYRCVLDSVFGGLLCHMQAALAHPGRLQQRLEATLVGSIDYLVQRPEAAHLMLREAATTDPTLRRVARAQAAPSIRLLGGLLEEGVGTGAWRPIPDVFHLASILAGTAVFYVGALRTLVADLPYDPLAPEQNAALKREVLTIARALLRPTRARRGGPARR